MNTALRSALLAERRRYAEQITRIDALLGDHPAKVEPVANGAVRQRRRGSRHPKPVRAGSIHDKVLTALASGGPMGRKQIANVTGVDSQKVSAALHRMHTTRHVQHSGEHGKWELASGYEPAIKVTVES